MKNIAIVFGTIIILSILLRPVVAPRPSYICSSQKQYDVVQRKCVCKNNFEGEKCDRNSSLCHGHTCESDEVCSKSVGAPNMPWCVAQKYQVHLLLRLNPANRAVSSKYIGWLENHVLSIYESKNPKPTTEDLLVEIMSAMKLISSGRLFVTLITFHNHSSYIPAADVCKSLDGKDLTCMQLDECKVLEAEGIRCPLIFTQWQHKLVPALPGGIVALIVAISVFVLTLSVGVLIVKIRNRYNLLQRTISLEELTEEVDDDF